MFRELIFRRQYKFLELYIRKQWLDLSGNKQLPKGSFLRWWFAAGPRRDDSPYPRYILPESLQFFVKELADEFPWPLQRISSVNDDVHVLKDFQEQVQYLLDRVARHQEGLEFLDLLEVDRASGSTELSQRLVRCKSLVEATMEFVQKGVWVHNHRVSELIPGQDSSPYDQIETTLYETMLWVKRPLIALCIGKDLSRLCDSMSSKVIGLATEFDRSAELSESPQLVYKDDIEPTVWHQLKLSFIHGPPAELHRCISNVVLRYETLYSNFQSSGFRAQAPDEVWAALQREFDVTDIVECFADALNRTANTAGSVNPDVDKFFYPNCIGTSALYCLEPPGRKIYMNPPFGEAVLLQSIRAIGRWMEGSNPPDLVILIVPVWDNTPSCYYMTELLKLKPFMNHCIRLPGGAHKFQLSKAPFLPPNDTLIAIFGHIIRNLDSFESGFRI